MKTEVNVNYQTGKLFPMILKFSIPAAVSLLITAIYNIVDRIFVGNFNGVSALALVLSAVLVLQEHRKLLRGERRKADVYEWKYR